MKRKDILRHLRTIGFGVLGFTLGSLSIKYVGFNLTISIGSILLIIVAIFKVRYWNKKLKELERKIEKSDELEDLCKKINL